MKISKKQVLWSIIIAVVSVLVIIFAVTSGNNDTETINQNNSVTINDTETENETENKVENEADNQEKTLPVFTYFVTDADLADKKTKESLDALEKEYADKVSFKICNVDKDAALLENFPIVKDNTPALIMLDANTDITGILFKTNDFETLKAEIEKVL